jgi:tetratricopeptide (TPR) repeat protein
MSKASLAVASPAPDPLDERELQAMRAKSPHAAELLEKGDERAAAGFLREAEALFSQAHAEYPDASILWRRDCETRIALGQRNEAIDACLHALERGRSDANVRALVSAFVDGPTAPTTTQLFEALILTAKEHDRSPGGATAAAAACDIAERIGDGVMLQRCAEELERTAPDDPATKKALSLLASRCPPWRFWGGWLAIAAAVAVTFGHALRRSLRRRPGRSTVAVAVLSATLWSFASPNAAAADESATPQHGWLSKWSIDDQNPSANIPSEKDRNADPLQFGYWLQDLTWKGEHASRRGDHAAAAKFYGALADAVPDRAIGFTMACQEYETLGDLDHAINACGQGLLREGTMVKDYAHFVALVMAKPGRLGHKETDALAKVLTHMREDPASRDFVDDLECQVGVRTSNVDQLKECTAALALRTPDSPSLLSYQWALAMEEKKFDQARDLIERARAAGMPAENLVSMEKKTSESERWRRIQIGLVLLATALLIGGAAIATRAMRQRRGALARSATPPVEKAAAPG